jgi:hypothetical protein
VIELLQSIIGWAIVIGIIYGVWWLSEIPHRNQWGKTIAWAKERGYTIPPRPSIFWWIAIPLAFCIFLLPGFFALHARKKSGERYATEMRALKMKFVDAQGG